MAWTIADLARAAQALREDRNYLFTTSRSERLRLCMCWLEDEAAFQQVVDLTRTWPPHRLAALRADILRLESPAPSRPPTVLTHDYERRPYADPITVTEGSAIPPAPETWLRAHVRDVLWMGGHRVSA